MLGSLELFAPLLPKPYRLAQISKILQKTIDSILKIVKTFFNSIMPEKRETLFQSIKPKLSDFPTLIWWEDRKPFGAITLNSLNRTI